jgi:hypothetical protein
MFGQGRSGNWLRAAKGAGRFIRLPSQWRRVVFYSEGAPYGKYLTPVVEKLCEETPVAYLTSDIDDPILNQKDSRIASFYIGLGSARTFVFQTLRAGVLVTTTPDLHTFHIKRSSVFPVQYVYLQHSLVSTHRVYRPAAFDHFDAIFCAGPHHMREIRAWESLNCLPPKHLLEHGYAPLDWLLVRGTAPPPSPICSEGLNVLVAPSWGPEGLLETGADLLVSELLNAGHRVVVRPHPVTTARSSDALRLLMTKFNDHSRFALDPDTTTMSALLDAHVMVSDWSGVAMEFAFGLGRPILFIDGPPKVNNPRWGELHILPLEDLYRSAVGEVVSRDRLHDLPKAVRTLWQSRFGYAARAKQLAQRYVYNLGTSSQAGAQIIGDLLRERPIALRKSAE